MKLKFAAAVIAASAGILISGTAFAWGEDGHKTVGAIAQPLLTPTAQTHLAQILQGDETLSSIAVWADCVKHPNLGYCNSDTAAHKQEWAVFMKKVGKANATNYHFSDIDIASTGYVYQANPSEEDVVHGIRESIAAIRGNADDPENPYHLTPRQGLWLLTHLVGDIHQPLHVGVEEVDGDIKATLGGNYLYPNNSSCLHSDWDDLYVKNAMKAVSATTPQQFATAISNHYKTTTLQKTDGDIMTWPITWANETMAVARDISYVNIQPGDKMTGTCGFGKHDGWAITLPQGYSNTAADTATNQIWKAGNRLADILNQAL